MLSRSRNSRKRPNGSLFSLPPRENILLEAFRAWMHQSRLGQCMLNGILASFQLISKAMTLRPQLKVLNGQLRAQFKAGRISFLDAQLQKKLITGQAICFTTLCDQTALQRAWQGHFANIEPGHGVDSVELLQLCGLEDLLQTTPGPDYFLCLRTLEKIEAPCVEHTHLERLALTTQSLS